MLPLALPSTNFIQQASTTATMLQPCANVPLPSIQPLVPGFICLHLITFKRLSRACHPVHPPALLLFDVMVRAVLWPWTLLRSTNHLLFNCISCLPTHWIVPVWIRVLCSLRLIHWKSLRRLGTHHSNYYIISSYGLFI